MAKISLEGVAIPTGHQHIFGDKDTVDIKLKRIERDCIHNANIQQSLSSGRLIIDYGVTVNGKPFGMFEYNTIGKREERYIYKDNGGETVRVKAHASYCEYVTSSSQFHIPRVLLSKLAHIPTDEAIAVRASEKAIKEQNRLKDEFDHAVLFAKKANAAEMFAVLEECSKGNGDFAVIARHLVGKIKSQMPQMEVDA